MKKIIIGIIIMTVCPFVVIFGSWLITQLNPPQTAKDIAAWFGGLQVLFSWLIGIALVIRGHQENQTFKGW